MKPQITLYCSFCGRSQHEVEQLIAGPTVFICGGCVDVCNFVIAEWREARGLAPKDGPQNASELTGEVGAEGDTRPNHIADDGKKVPNKCS